MTRKSAPSEDELHSTLKRRGTADGALKGGLLGGAAGAALKHLGQAKGGFGAGAAAGALLGGAAGHLRGKERVLRDTVTQERQHQRSEARMKKAAAEAFGEGMAKAATVVADLVTHDEGTVPLKKKAMIHPSMQQPSETMTGSKWKQTAKDIPFAALAGGLGYGIGRTLAEVIGEGIASTGQRPGWTKAIPIAATAVGLAGAYASSRARDGMKHRREGEKEASLLSAGIGAGISGLVGAAGGAMNAAPGNRASGAMKGAVGGAVLGAAGGAAAGRIAGGVKALAKPGVVRPAAAATPRPTAALAPAKAQAAAPMAAGPSKGVWVDTPHSSHFETNPALAKMHQSLQGAPALIRKSMGMT